MQKKNFNNQNVCKEEKCFFFILTTNLYLGCWFIFEFVFISRESLIYSIYTEGIGIMEIVVVSVVYLKLYRIGNGILPLVIWNKSINDFLR